MKQKAKTTCLWKKLRSCILLYGFVCAQIFLSPLPVLYAGNPGSSLQNPLRQGAAKIWYFGDGAGLDFNSSPPAVLKDDVYLSAGGSAVICDREGKLLFYTDGAQVWNCEHVEMSGGNALTGSSYAEQPALILPAPENPDVYYIFTASASLGLYYSLVDMRLDDGLGSVTEKNIRLWPEAAGKMTAVVHENTHDIWLLVPSARDNSLHAYLVTASGVRDEPVISKAGIGHSKTEFDWAGFLKASPDGRKLALSVFDPGFFELFDFDATSGKVSNPVFLGEYESAYGLEFSPDGTKLYSTVVSWVHKHIYQFDLEVKDIAGSVEVIGETGEEARFRALQLGPDGRIYVARENSTHLGCIENPNQKGIAAEYIDKGLYLDGRLCRNDLPTFLQSLFLPPVIRLAVNDPQSREGDDALIFTIALSDVSRSDISVAYETLDKSARAGQDYLPSSGRLTIPAGESEARISVMLVDDVDFDEGPEMLTLRLSEPLRAEFEKDAGDGTILDNDLVRLSIQGAEAGEGAGRLIFPVSLSQPSRSDVSVNYRSADGNAQEGEEYQGAGGTLVIPAGEASAVIEIDITDDAFDEEEKTLFVQLSEPVNAELDKVRAEGTILDDDEPPVLTIEDAVLLEKNSAMTFPVRLSAVSALDVTVDYATVDENAIAGEDYQPASGTIFIPAGATLGTILVDVNDDALDEEHERFTVVLSRPENARLGDSQSCGIIKDNDEAPVLVVDDMSANEGSGALNFILKLSAPSGRDVSVAYRTTDGTATAGIDYDEQSGDVAIPAGSQGAMLSLPLHDDADYERDETFSLIFSEAQCIGLPKSRIVATIRNDDEPPELSISDVSTAEDTGALEFTISLSGASYEAVSLRAASVDDSATIAGNDYRLLPEAELVIPAGETSVGLSVPVYDDHLPEGDERFFIQLYDAVNATLLKERGEGRILDNDALPTLSIGDGVFDKARRSVTFTVSLSETSALPVIVGYATEDGTAKQKIDYASLEGMLAIAPQNESGTITVSVIPAEMQRDQLHFRMVLHDLHNAVFEKQQGIGSIE